MLRTLGLVPPLPRPPVVGVTPRSDPPPSPAAPPAPPKPKLVIPHGTTAIMRVADEDYFPDPCERPSLSHSIAKILNQQSPAHAYAMHPRYGGGQSEPTRSTTLGSLAHVLLLGEGPEIIGIEAKDFKTKRAQAERDEAIAAGALPVLLDTLERVELAVKAIRARLADIGVRLDGACEMAAFWVEEANDGTEVQCRGRIDHLQLSRFSGTIHDLKSIVSAHPDTCAKHVDVYDYATQRAAYVRAIEANRPDLEGRVDFRLLFFELEPPYAVVPAVLDGRFRAIGEQRWRRAVNKFARCQRTGRWPDYVQGREWVTLEPPPWLMVRELEREDEERGAAAEE